MINITMTVQVMQVGMVGIFGGGNMDWQSYPFLVTPKELGTAFVLFKKKIAKMTKPLKFKQNGIVKKLQLE